MASESGSGIGRQPGRGVAAAEGVAGVRVLELGHRADVARGQPLDLDPLLALLDRQVVELLRRLVLRVPDLLAVPDVAGVQAEQGHVAHVRLGHGLEHPAHQGRLGRRRALGRRGQQLDHLPEQGPETIGLGGAAAEQRHDLAGQHRLLHRADELLAGDLLAGEIPLDEIVVGRGDGLGQVLAVLPVALLVLRRDGDDLVLALARALLVQVTVPGEQVDDPVEIGPVADRDLDRHHLRRQMGPHVGEDPLEVRVLLVHEADEQDAGQMQLIEDFPDLFGPNLDPAGAAHHDHGGVGGVQAGDDFAEVVEVARGIDEVELGVHPLGVAEREVDRVLAGDFVGGVIGEGRSVSGTAMAPAGAGHPSQCIHERRLSTAAVADERHVSDGLGAIDLHGLHLLTRVEFSRWRPPPELSIHRRLQSVATCVPDASVLEPTRSPAGLMPRLRFGRPVR